MASNSTHALTPTGSHIVPAWRYLAAWAALMSLTGITFALSLLPLGNASIAVSLTIAFVKATIVVIMFMHLLSEHGAVRLTLVIAFSLTLVLATLVIVDFKTRFPPAIAGEGPAIPLIWKPDEYSGQPPPLTPARQDWRRPAQADQGP